MKFALLCAAFMLTVATPAMAAPSADTPVVPAEVKAQTNAFFGLLEKDQAEKAIGDVIASSPLWSNRAGVKEQMMAQVDAAAKIYGPVVSHELISTEALGTMILRQYWLIQHRDVVTRWEFDFMRTSAGWKVAYFGFTDQVQGWF